MTEEEIINLVWERLKDRFPKAKISKRATERVIKTFLETLGEVALKEAVKFRNFGTFKPQTRRYKNPQGQAGTSRRVVFKPSRKLRVVSGVRI